LHKHDFAQVWYIIDGEFQMGDKTYNPGTLVYMGDPHFENEMRTETGGTVLFVQYPGPTRRLPSALVNRPRQQSRARQDGRSSNHSRLGDRPLGGRQ
jgi:hypothetical protein